MTEIKWETWDDEEVETNETKKIKMTYEEALELERDLYIANMIGDHR